MLRQNLIITDQHCKHTIPRSRGQVHHTKDFLKKEKKRKKDTVYFFFYLKNRIIETKRERQRGRDPPSTGLLSKRLQQRSLDKDKARSPEFHLDLPQGGRNQGIWSIISGALAGRWIVRQMQDSISRTPLWDSSSTHWTTTPTTAKDFWVFHAGPMFALFIPYVPIHPSTHVHKC